MVYHYPKIESNNFKSICQKKEFLKYKTSRSISSDNENRMLLPHQQFLANYINPLTPYKGILIYHETGTGKTCTAVSIAENFKEIVNKYGKKITILSSESIKPEFLKTIKSTDTPFKCTGDEYVKKIDKNTKTTPVQESKLMNEIINNYYEFKTYQTLGNDIINIVKKFKKKTTSLQSISQKCVEIIKERYSNSVIIVDEAHNLRSKFGNQSDIKTKNTNSGKSVAEKWIESYIKKPEDVKIDNNKVSHDIIDLIVEYADNLKLIFLTATPMFDNPIEIIWLINKLIKVNRDPIKELDETEIFTSTYKFKSEDAKQKFERALKGKVSYLRSGDPSKFPLRIEDPSFYTTSELSNSHFNKIQNTNFEKDSFMLSAAQLHNISWYSTETYNGLQAHFDVSLTSKPAIYEFRNKKGSKNIFDDLQTYAPKVKTIIDFIEKMDDGIAFVFSKFIWSGILPVILALENMGYSQYREKNDNTNLLKTRKIQDAQKSYAIITSSPHFSYEKQEKIVNALRSEENKYGKKIRVVLVSSSGGEGIDLRFIRQVHILEPHFNFSLLEQVVGRAIRTDSHKALPPEKRNCTVFYHTTKHSKKKYDGIEKEIYEKAQLKKNGIQNVRKILQEYSVSCQFFKETNEFELGKLRGKDILDSFGKSIKYEPVDDDNVYKINCILCNDKDTEDAEYKEDLDSYHPINHSNSQIYICMKWIFDLFRIAQSYTLEDIVSHIQYRNSAIDEYTIYHALYIIENNSEYLLDNQFGIRGMIVYDEPFFKFKTEYFDYMGMNNFKPIQYTNEKVFLNDLKFSIDDTSETTDFQEHYQEIIKLYQSALKSPNFSNDNFWDTDSLKEKRDTFILQAIIDKMDDKTRLKLLMSSQGNENNLNNPEITNNEKNKDIYALMNQVFQNYKLEDGFKSLENTKTPYKIVKESKTKIQEVQFKKFPNSKNLPLSSFILFEKEHFIFKVLDRRTTKGIGANLGSAGDATKKKLLDVINTLIEIYCNFKKIPIFKRYENGNKTNPSSIDLLDKKQKPSNKMMYLECELLFRLLNDLGVDDKLWFVPSWKIYEYGLPESAKN
tara:strand:- start:2755 stop:5961 length:3207 start_codon:yes stop_codon:yes gene_type:complete